MGTASPDGWLRFFATWLFLCSSAQKYDAHWDWLGVSKPDNAPEGDRVATVLM
jgi:hypothetical protein